MSPLEASLLVAGGFVAGVINTLAGGGSMMTVPLLVLLGLPGTLANGTNRVGILLQSLAAAWRFRVEGVAGVRSALPVVIPVAAGSMIGALAVAQVSDETFERLFGVLMVLLLVPTLRGRSKPDAEIRDAAAGARSWPRVTVTLALFAVGLYGGAFQVGVGILLLFALSHGGLDLVRANAVKVQVIAAVTLVAVPVFAIEKQIAWLPAGFLAVGFTLGGALGVRLAVRGGEKLIRPVLALAVIALAGRMFGLL